MEYTILKDLQKNRKFFYIVLVLLFLLFPLAFVFLGYFGVWVYLLLLFFLILTPLFYHKKYLFIVLWLLIVPLFDSYTSVKIMGANSMTVLATFITVFSASITYFNHFVSIWRELPYVRYMIIFAVILFLNCFRPDSSLSSLMDVFRYFIQGYLIYLIFLIYNENKAKVIGVFNLINLFVVINSIVSIVQWLTGIGLLYVDGIKRSPGLLAHPNVTAMVVNIYLPMAIYMLTKTETKKTKIFFSIGILVSVLSLILTFTKVAYLCFVVMSILLIFCLPTKIKLKTFFIVISSIFLIVVTNLVLHLRIIETILIRFGENSSYEWRLFVWRLLMHDINLGNICLGHGTGSAYKYLTVYGIQNMAHNVYLQLIYEYGLTSIFFFMSLIVVLILFIKAFFNKELIYRLDYIFPITILVQIFINMYSDNMAFSRTPMYFAWVIITYFYLTLKIKDSVIKISN